MYVFATFYFNPRSHEGSDGTRRTVVSLMVDFNPRSHEGSDGGSGSDPGFQPISIHAPTRGATQRPFRRLQMLLYFNPRSHEGSDKTYNPRLICPRNFNPRSHEGSDGGQAPWGIAGKDFNPRSHEGSDALRPSSSYGLTLFQSTLPRGERLCPRRNLTP